MIPQILTLKNFEGVRSGLRRNEVTLNLSEIEGPLVALIGPNGSAKTTLLDNMHPYRLMPSRASSYSPSAFSFYDHTYGVAEKILVWTHDSKAYKSHIVIHGDIKTKRTEAYLFELVGKTFELENPIWNPVRLSDGTVSDGKNSTYDACVEEILGSPELFFTAAFACQGRMPLAGYTNGAVKSMMSELLGMDRVRELCGIAIQVVRGREHQLKQFRNRSVDFERISASLSEHRHDLDVAKDELDVVRLQKDVDIEKQGAANAELLQAQAAAKNAEAIEERRSRLEARKVGFHHVRHADEADVALEEKRAGQERDGVIGAEVTRGLHAKSRVASLGAQVSDAEGLIADRDKITGADEEESAAREELNAVRTSLTEARVVLEEIRRIEGGVAIKSLDKGTHLARADQARERLKGLIERASLVTEVPCHGMESLTATCKLLAEAREAVEGAEKGKPIVEEMDRKTSELSSAIDGLIASAPDLPRVVEMEREKDAAQNRVNEAVGLTHRAEALRRAETAMQQLREDLDAAKQHEEDSLALVSGAGEKFDERMGELSRRREEIGARHRESYDGVMEELKGLPDPTVGAVDAAQLSAERHAKSIKDADIRMSSISNRIGREESEIEALSTSLKDREEVDRNTEALVEDLAQWKLLREALSNDGIVALSIDDAGPTISGIANELLLACFGPRYTLSIRTQSETQAGTTKEVFDIIVFDGDDGSEKSVSVMSGGQKIYINEALTRAIALFQAQNSGRKYGCLFADESDGALDEDRKQEFVAMKRKVLELGGYQREIFISHTPDVWNAADAVIDMKTI